LAPRFDGDVGKGGERGLQVLGKGEDRSAAVVVVLAPIDEAGAFELAREEARRRRGEVRTSRPARPRRADQ
jgi:hypothetical protein